MGLGEEEDEEEEPSELTGFDETEEEPMELLGLDEEKTKTRNRKKAPKPVASERQACVWHKVSGPDAAPA